MWACIQTLLYENPQKITIENTTYFLRHSSDQNLLCGMYTKYLQMRTQTPVEENHIREDTNHV